MGPAIPDPDRQPSTPAILAPDLDALIGRHPALAIHFWASWQYRLDEALDQTIRSIRPTFAGRVHFVACNLDRDDGLGRRCRLVNSPAIVLIVGGKIQPAIYGANLPPARVAALIELRLSRSRVS